MLDYLLLLFFCHKVIKSSAISIVRKHPEFDKFGFDWCEVIGVQLVISNSSRIIEGKRSNNLFPWSIFTVAEKSSLSLYNITTIPKSFIWLCSIWLFMGISMTFIHYSDSAIQMDLDLGWLGDCGLPIYTNLYVFQSPKVTIWSYFKNIKFLIFFLHNLPRIFEHTF